VARAGDVCGVAAGWRALGSYPETPTVAQGRLGVSAGGVVLAAGATTRWSATRSSGALSFDVATGALSALDTSGRWSPERDRAHSLPSRRLGPDSLLVSGRRATRVRRAGGREHRAERHCREFSTRSSVASSGELLQLHSTVARAHAALYAGGRPARCWSAGAARSAPAAIACKYRLEIGDSAAADAPSVADASSPRASSRAHPRLSRRPHLRPAAQASGLDGSAQRPPGRSIG
jgi:hypothetical protein